MAIHDLVRRGREHSVPVRQQGRFGRSLISLQDDMNRLFQDFFGDSPLSSWPERFESFPAIDMIDGEKDIKIKAELSGINPDDVEVSVTNGYLTIQGERQQEQEEKDENFLRREMSYGSFQRTVALPDMAESDKAEASFKNGILTVTVPKKAEALQKSKKLQIKKAA